MTVGVRLSQVHLGFTYGAIMPRRSNIRITEKTVKLKPRERPFEIRDRDLRGFILRIQPTGTKTFYCEWAQGKRSRIGDTALMTVERARDIAEHRISGAKRGEIPQPQIRNSIPTLEKFIDGQYEVWALTHQKAGTGNVQRIRGAFPTFLDTRLDLLTAWSFEQWKIERKKQGKAPATINRDLTMIRAALNKAVDWGEIQSNPLNDVKQLRNADNKRVRYLLPDEEQRLMAALDEREAGMRQRRQSGNEWREQRSKPALPAIGPDDFADYLKPMVLVAMNTGMRYGEMSRVRWSDVHLGDPPGLNAQAAHTKTDKMRHIPLNPPALATLRTWKAQQRNTSGYVFQNKNGGRLKQLESSWENVITKAKIKNFTWHDFRHDFASKLVMSGADLNDIRELLGHSSIDMTLRYAHLAPEKLAAAVALINQSGVSDLPTAKKETRK